MEAMTQQLGILACVWVAAFIGPALALSLLLLRKRRARARRRSPIAISLLRSPGDSLRVQLDEARLDMAFELIILSSIPLTSLALFLAQGHVRGLQATAHSALLYFGTALAVVLFVIHKLWKAGIQVDKLKAGFDAELAVGQELNQLMRQGAAVFHDLPAENFNIDHVVISSEGVFAVETKGFTKPSGVWGRRTPPSSSTADR